MKTFMQISDDGSRGHYKFKAESRPEWHPRLILIDITGIVPEPEEGWLWDGKTFTPPPPPPDPPKDKVDLLEAQIAELTSKMIMADAKIAALDVRMKAAESKVGGPG